MALHYPIAARLSSSFADTGLLITSAYTPPWGARPAGCQEVGHGSLLVRRLEDLESVLAAGDRALQKG
jgi:hypothetical protein